MISGNGESGIDVLGLSPVDSDDVSQLITGNLIGLAADGVTPLGNAKYGITFTQIPWWTACYNTIAHNGLAGVNVVTVGGRAYISGNTIFGNGGLAIDLDGDGLTPNDPGDADTGANGRQNHPELTAAQMLVTGMTTVTGQFDSAPNALYRIEYYSTGGVAAPGMAARRWVGFDTVTTGADGLATFTHTMPDLTAGDYIVATATAEDGSTSEVGVPRLIAAVPLHTISGTVTRDGAPVAGVTLTLGGTVSASTVTDAAGHYRFDGLPFGGGYMIFPKLANHTFMPGTAPVPSLNGDLTVDFAAALIWRSRYLTEGATGGFWQTRLSLLNGSASPAEVELRFRRDGGGVTSVPISLAANSHATFDPASVPGLEQAAFSTEVRATQPLVASRTTRWGVEAIQGAHAEQAVLSPRTSWYFAEGATGCFSLFYLLQNPTGQAAEVDVTFLRRAPEAPVVQHYRLDPYSRASVNVNGVPGLDFAEVASSIEVTNGVGILAERAMYASCGGEAWRGGHGAAASPAPAETWFLAEGATGSFFDLYLLLANFGAADAQVEVTYLLADGQTITKPHTVPARSRISIDVASEDPALTQAEVSMRVVSTNGTGIVAERAQWWPHGAWYEGHASVGVTQTGVEWQLAGVEAGGDRAVASYLPIANTGDTEGQAQVRLVFEDGTSAELAQPVPLAPHNRRTISLADAFPAVAAAGRRFGLIVTSVGAAPAPIIVELSSYEDTPGDPAAGDHAPLFWGAGTSTTGTRLH